MFRGGIGAPEILLILGVVVLLFGGKKLPELARGSGKALRIFKTEVTSLTESDDEKSEDKTEAVKTRSIGSENATASEKTEKPEQA